VSALAVRYALLAVAVVTLNFALPRLLSGDPLANPDTPTLSAQQQAALRATYRLDQPLPAQFANYLADLGHADLGWSISRNAPVADLIRERLPWTLALVLTSVLIAAVAGTTLGVLSAWRGGRLDGSIVSLCASVAAIPEFLVAMLLLLVLAVGTGWFPLTGGQSPFAAPDRPWTSQLGDRVSHLALPAATLVLANLAAFVLLARGAVRAVLHDPYLATARGKGLSEQRVAFEHAAPNALLPVLTLFGMRLGQVLGGAIVVERVFGVPGLGLFAFQAIQARDYPVLQAIFLLASLSVLLANLGMEVAYRRLEPRRVASRA
jgi:peptide/nickel transport system permease protein